MKSWGGSRKGSGRKPVARKYSDELKTNLYKALKKKAEVTSKSFGDVIAELAYDDTEKNGNLRLGAIRAIIEILLIKETKAEADLDIRPIGPTICLPPLLPKPTDDDYTDLKH
jgi:hypothetical protein